MARAWMLAVVLLALVAAPAAAEVTLQQVGTFEHPVYVTAAPGDGTRLFVVEQGGLVRVIRDGVTLERPFADLRDRLSVADERGLLSIAFAPDYAASGLLYAFYTDLAGDLVVAELRRSPDPDAIDLYRREVLKVAHPGQANHNGGQLQFGPDGLLYAGTGDGGGRGDPDDNAQDSGSLLGKLLRIDPRVPGAAPEIVAKGLRNPWRFSFDRLTGDLTIGDVGQNTVEEVNFAAPAGLSSVANYGWDRFEGDQLYDASVAISEPVVFPVITHDHTEQWCSVTGGYVMRDPGSELYGRYVYGDLCRGEVWAATLPEAADDARLGPDVAVRSLTTFGEDACGRLYVASHEGPVHRLSTATATCEPAPAAAPPAPVAAADRTAPALRLTAPRRQRVLRTGRLQVGVACDEPCTATVTARALGRRAAHVRRTLAAGRVALQVPVPRTVRRAMARSLLRRASLALDVSVRVADAAGNTRTARVRVRVVRR